MNLSNMVTCYEKPNKFTECIAQTPNENGTVKMIIRLMFFFCVFIIMYLKDVFARHVLFSHFQSHIFN